MAIYAYAALEDPEGYRNVFALDSETIDARAAEIAAEWDEQANGGPAPADYGRVSAETEARARARAELNWPSDWQDQGYAQYHRPAPLHPTYEANVDAWFWDGGMPDLP